jgi:hypothetical protein
MSSVVGFSTRLIRRCVIPGGRDDLPDDDSATINSMAMIVRRLIRFKFDEIKQIAAQWEEQEQVAPDCPTPKYRGVVKTWFKRSLDAEACNLQMLSE